MLKKRNINHFQKLTDFFFYKNECDNNNITVFDKWKCHGFFEQPKRQENISSCLGL